MSLDYSRAVATTKVSIPADAAIANATTVIPRSYTWSYDQPYLVLALHVYIATAATSATQSLVLQKSNTSGSFASPTTMATITILSSNAAGTKLKADISAASADLVAGEVLRLAHVATSTDASLVYQAELVVTPRHD